jgi:hypothetical protein
VDNDVSDENIASMFGVELCRLKNNLGFSAVGIATGYGLDDRVIRVRVPVGSRIFSSPRRPDWLWGPPASYPMGTGGLFLLG